MRPNSRKNGIIIQDYQEETLVYDLDTNKAFCLNATSAHVWKACNGNRTIPEITQHLKKELDESANEKLVEFALDQLSKEGLIEGYESAIAGNAGISRRSAIKTLGLSTAIALPIIASLVAPPAAYAQSCTGVGMAGNAPGCPCTSNLDCNSGTCSGNPMTCM